MGDPQNGWFQMENHTKMDDTWGYPYFRTSPYIEIIRTKTGTGRL